jgi:hypothetical protein
MKIGYRFQNIGVNKTSKVNISSRPNNIAKHNIHFAAAGSWP